MSIDYNLNGADRIARERNRQVSEEGRTLEADRTQAPGSLALAGLAYALMAANSPEMRAEMRTAVTNTPWWPWPAEWWKPGRNDDYADRIRELEKAGALIAAQIDVYLAEQKATMETFGTGEQP